MTNIKWSYMEHWGFNSPRGPATQYASKREMDRFVKQIAVLGFTGLDIMDINMAPLREMFGSLESCRTFLRERGIEKVASIFHTPWYMDARHGSPHIPASHDALFRPCEEVIKSSEGLGAENFIVMPAPSYRCVEPVTDDKIKAMAEFWNRVGQMTLAYGIKTVAHHEFWNGIRSREEIEKFYQWTDPEFVFYCVDTAQTVIAGDDPVELYEKYHDRCAAFHFKDTHNVDTKGEYRLPPDAELSAPSVWRWFWEMGTPEGLVDFEAAMRALAKHGYQGWITVEHDKANVGGGSYSESTCIAMWYAHNVLAKIYA